MRERRIISRPESIEYFDGGVRIITPANVDLPKSDARGIRGDVKGWSSASRRRMREFLLTHKPADGLNLYGITLTVPGPNISPEQARHLFNHFSKHYIVRNGCGMVWRLEVQKRGAVHWHGIVAARPDGGTRSIRTNAVTMRGPPLESFDGENYPVPTSRCLRDWWLSALRVLGKCDHDQKWGDRDVTWLDIYRDQIPGADVHAVDVQEEGGKGAWLRYLQDHATKSKQDQIAKGFGRHWGVVGRGCFVVARPVDSHDFTSRKTFSRFLRAYQRMIRPVMSWRHRRESCRKFDKRPFRGRSLGWATPRGSRGVSVWFSKPETVQKLVAWAEDSCIVGGKSQTSEGYGATPH